MRFASCCILSCLCAAVAAQESAPSRAQEGADKASADPATRELVRRLLGGVVKEKQGAWSCRTTSPAYAARMQLLARRGRAQRVMPEPYRMLVSQRGEQRLWVATQHQKKTLADWQVLARGPRQFHLGRKDGEWETAQQPCGVWARVCLVEPSHLAQELLARIDKAAWKLKVETVEEQQRRYYSLELDNEALEPFLRRALLPQAVDYFNSLPSIQFSYLGRPTRMPGYTAEIRLYVDRKTKALGRIHYSLFAATRLGAAGVLAVRVGGALPPAKQAANKTALSIAVELDLTRRATLQQDEAKLIEAAWAAVDAKKPKEGK